LGQAEDAYASLEQIAPSVDVRNLARLNKERIRDKRVVLLVQQAEEYASRNEFGRAVEVLTQAHAVGASDRLKERILQKHYQYSSRQIITEWSKDHEVDLSSVWAVVSGGGVESRALRDSIATLLKDHSGQKPSVRSVSDATERAIVSGSLTGQKTSSNWELASAGARLLFVGTESRHFVVLYVDVERVMVRPVLRILRLGPVSGRPTGGVWDDLVSKETTDLHLQVAVWSDRRRYRTGDEIVFHVRTTKDCYLTLVDLQTSGGLYVLFPNSYQAESFVRAGETVAIGGRSSPFAIGVKGPPGVEGVKVIGSPSPLFGAESFGAKTFVHAISESEREALGERITKLVDRFPDGEWDVAEWTFEVVD